MLEPNNEITTTKQKIQEEIVIKTIQVCPEFSVCHVSVARVAEDGSCELVQREETRPTVAPEDPYFGQYCVVAPELLEKLHKGGWFADSKDFELISRTPFSHVLSGEPYVLVRIKSYDHTLYTPDGLRLPVGILYNEINGRANNAHFDLGKLLSHLEARDDITFNLDRWTKGKVHSTPGYNAGDSCGTRYISFIWHPTVELYREYAQLSEKAGKTIFDHRDIGHTLMGNDTFRIPPKPVED